MDGNRIQKSGITRRGVLTGAAMLGIGAGLDHLLAAPESAGHGDVPGESRGAAVPFYGARQAGIDTPAQEFLDFATFDLTSDSVDDLREILKQWTAAAAALTAGRRYEPTLVDTGEAPIDTGEGVGLGPSQLTITIGFGPSLFGSSSGNRFGFARRRPSRLRTLPPFRGESIDPERSDGDLCVQACADDPQVTFHAIHVLARLASGAATLRWSQQGFGRTSSTSSSQPTPRNLMGFKDGTDNIRAEDTEAMNRFVWVQSSDGPHWMTGGSYLIARRIQILLDVWDATSLEGQERVIGREKLSGAPLGAHDEYDPVDLAAKKNGSPTIPADAHIRLASPDYNDGQRILRRGYSYSEPPEPGSGQIDAGLFFICFQRDPRRQFIPLQRRLAASDALNRHTLHTASAIFACPAGCRPGGFIGEGLFA
ncbi:MAG TPA: iron uptake transporter deferrochelatase/peroxidase subunit [Solirubrobacterales bacterium]|nr:iron uptake transporter deferrochelatase/peroxidase subunit [Solirubrobacterales bacterium]